MFYCKKKWLGAPGWLRRLSVLLWIAALVLILGQEVGLTFSLLSAQSACPPSLSALP